MMAQIDQIEGFLKELDSRLSTGKHRKLYLIGGAAITILYDHGNRTADLDFIDPPETLVQAGGKGSPLAAKFNVYVSPVVGINFSVPSDWKSGCRSLPLKLKNLEILVPSLEDIVLGKLARLEPKDFEDILSLHEKKLLNSEDLLKRLNENSKELKNLSYRSNAKLLFQEVFRRKLVFQGGRYRMHS